MTITAQDFFGWQSKKCSLYYDERGTHKMDEAIRRIYKPRS